MMRPFRYLLLLTISSSLSNVQEFERSWGNYYGPAGTDLGNSKFAKVKFDANNNLNFVGAVNTSNTYTASYYNQFSTAGTGYDITKLVNFVSGVVNNNGSVSSTSYVGTNGVFDLPNISFNNVGDRFVYQFSNQGITSGGTSGTWFPTSTAAGANKVLFSKYSSSGVLQWTTFLPTLDASSLSEIAHDTMGNTFVTGTTLNQNIGTPGAFQSSFIIRYDPNGNPLPNPFIAKLNSAGQLVWATYYPAEIYKLRYHDGNVYLSGNIDLDSSLSQMATANAFQSQKTGLSITKLSATDGSRVWGTYYGPVGSAYINIASGFDVNETGLYAMGDIYDLLGTGNTYFGTPGSFQTSPSGNSDIYLTKFNLDGGRVWSTYFGSSSEEISSLNSEPLKVFGSDIYITGFQQVLANSGSPTNLATPGSHVSSPPTFSGSANVSHNNLFFAKFSTNGTREWSSYYGGAAPSQGLPPSINISVLDANTFYLHGSTVSLEGISTEGAAQMTGVSGTLNGFLARFDRKILSTAETTSEADLILYDNPNSGIFTVEGDILKKNDLSIRIFDMSGRLLFQQKMNNQRKQMFNFQGRLKTGNYSVQIYTGSQVGKIFKVIVN